MPSICKALGSILSTKKKEKREGKSGGGKGGKERIFSLAVRGRWKREMNGVKLGTGGGQEGGGEEVNRDREMKKLKIYTGVSGVKLNRIT